MIIQRIKTLYARIIVALLVLSVLPLSVYFTITNTFIEETLVDEIQRANHEIAVHATDNINATIHHTIEKIVQATNLLELDALDVAEQEWALQSIHKLMPETIQLTIFNAQGDVVVNWMKSAVKKGYKKSDFSIHLMSNALKGKKTIGSISVSSNGQKTLDFSLPLYDPVKNKMVAVLIVKMSLEQLLPQMRTLKREGNAKIFIIDKQRRYVVHPDVSLVLSDKKIQESPLVKSYLNGNIEFQAQQYVTENDINVLAVAQYVDVINALLIVEQPADEALQTLNWIKRTLTVFCIVLFLFMLLVIYYFGMKVIKPLANLRYGAEAVGRGVFDLTLPVQSDDELSEVVTAFNKMALNLKNITQERNKELWLKDNVSLLHQNFQGEKSMSLLCQEVMNYLASISRAQLGALYIMKDTDQTLSQHASYALPMPSELAITYQSGEGLIGQVAVNKVLTRLKPSQDSFTVDAGINRVIPKDVLVLPFVFDNETQAVILLASLKLFDEKVPELLERISETVAAVVHSTRSRIKIAALLSDAQSQKEQLQLTNNNLSQKTQALNDTRIELEAQQEELKVSNEELEEKAEYLQQQQCRIEESNEQLEASRQKLAISSQYKSDFLANMSHELRSPLNSILLFSQSLAENKGDNLTDKQVEFAETIGHSGKELLTLINDILDIAKIESGKTVLTIGEYKPKSLPAYIKKMFGFQVKKKGLELVFQVDESLPEIIRTDTHRLGQIIKNFLSNAIKFTEQGEIRVSIGLQQSDQIFIAVKDSGIGIAPDKQGLVFESFQQADSSTSRKYGGTGLGLPISKELADLLGGHIELTSQLGEGCTFTLFLPTNQTEQVAEVVDVISEPILDSMVEINHQDVENVIIENTLQDDRDDILERDRSLLIVDDDEPFAKLLLDLGRQHQF